MLVPPVLAEIDLVVEQLNASVSETPGPQLMMRRAEKREPVCPVCRKPLIKGVVQRERAGGRIAVYEALTCPSVNCSYKLPLRR
jgi:hypothetical protein